MTNERMTADRRADRIWAQLDTAMFSKTHLMIVEEIKQAEEEAGAEGFQRGLGTSFQSYKDEFIRFARNEAQIKILESYEKGYAAAREEAAKKVQNFKWSTDNDSEVTEILACKIRSLQPKARTSGEGK